MRLRPLAAGAFFFLLVARSGQVRSWSGVDSERKSRLAASHNILDRGRCNSNAPEVVVSDACAATRGSILLLSFLASRRACFGKPLGDFIADAEEYFVGSPNPADGLQSQPTYAFRRATPTSKRQRLIGLQLFDGEIAIGVRNIPSITGLGTMQTSFSGET
jgi:hypothetical protein